MARADQTEIRMRIVIDKPMAGIVYSLQDKASQPVDPQLAGKDDLVFDFTVWVSAGPKFYGEHVRSEGPERRFVYIASGGQAGQAHTEVSRRLKIDIHALPQALVDKAIKGKVLEVTMAGADPDGRPTCASRAPLKAWKAV